ncbi:hypothetical protein MLD38_007478 [Melastoma candidum]|uniref:Uncharacterized protein n=1 Tax=Melastoma candidum TaxID=119954 RepID=A0ACB9RSH7_9MYRT|nr:hypothetical protein MLD38_007478 [Melastoma candidum]
MPVNGKRDNHKTLLWISRKRKEKEREGSVVLCGVGVRMGYIGSHGVATLHRYKYSGVDHSYLAKYVLQPFWSRCVNFFPLWMP